MDGTYMTGAVQEDAANVSERLLVPTHMKHVTSLHSMEEGFSDNSQSDVEVKSRSSGIGLELDSPVSTPGFREWDYYEVEGEESGPLCGGAVNLKEYISDLTLLSHEAVIGDVPSGALYRHQPQADGEDASMLTENACTSTYGKWKKLSGPVLLFAVLGLVVLVWGRTHLFQLLQWLEGLPLHQSMLVFIFLFTLISFPFGFGYIILNMMAGYLYGIVRGQLIVMVSVGVGNDVVLLAVQGLCQKHVTSNALQAVLRVMDGPHGFKVIFLTRFTPVPFGLQNVLFAVSLFGWLVGWLVYPY